MSYAIGQVLFVVLKKENRVWPMQICKVINERTLDGEVTSYMIRGGSDPKATMMITDIDGEIFDSSDRARSVLIDRATKSINKLVDTAVTKSKEWYPGAYEAPSNDALAALRKTPGAVPTMLGYGDEDETNEEVSNVIEMPDGTKARIRSVKIPDALK